MCRESSGLDLVFSPSSVFAVQHQQRETPMFCESSRVGVSPPSALFMPSSARGVLPPEDFLCEGVLPSFPVVTFTSVESGPQTSVLSGSLVNAFVCGVLADAPPAGFLASGSDGRMS